MDMWIDVDTTAPICTLISTFCFSFSTSNFTCILMVAALSINMFVKNFYTYVSWPASMFSYFNSRQVGFIRKWRHISLCVYTLPKWAKLSCMPVWAIVSYGWQILVGLVVYVGQYDTYCLWLRFWWLSDKKVLGTNMFAKCSLIGFIGPKYAF